MDLFGDTDILGVWVQLLFSRFGLMVVGLAVASILVASLARTRRRGPPRR